MMSVIGTVIRKENRDEWQKDNSAIRAVHSGDQREVDVLGVI